MIITYMSVCMSVYVGSYCGTSGLSSPTAQCDAGYYCPPGQLEASPPAHACTPGHKCPVGSPAELACAAGMYQDEATQVCLM